MRDGAARPPATQVAGTLGGRLAWLVPRLRRPPVRPGPGALSAEAVDRLITAAGEGERSGEGLDHLAAKLDHLVHALGASGRLARLSHGQIVTILHALRVSGHDEVPVIEDIRYDREGMTSIHSTDFMREPRFVEAYRRGVEAADAEYIGHWRVHLGLWVAVQAAKLPGDFVECGVNRGFLSAAIMRYLGWNRLGKRFILMDTFRGLDEAFITAEERALGKTSAFEGYVECHDEVVRSFAEFENVVIIRGSIPTTLPRADTDAVCYLHLDMNNVLPEVAAITYFWDRLVPGAFVLLDDYAVHGYEVQKRGMDEFASRRGVEILSLPTGQGLIQKSP